MRSECRSLKSTRKLGPSCTALKPLMHHMCTKAADKNSADGMAGFRTYIGADTFEVWNHFEVSNYSQCLPLSDALP